MFWLGVLTGAGGILLTEVIVLGIFGYNLGKEIAEDYAYDKDVFYPAGESDEEDDVYA